MRIQQIHLNNIGVFEGESIEFQPCPTKGKAEIHVFTGTNGSGKSTLLYALAAATGGVSKKAETLFCKRFRFERTKLNDKDKHSYTSYLFIKTDDSRYLNLIIGANEFGQLVHRTDSGIEKPLTNHINFTANVNFAAFAYSGLRSAENIEIDAVRDQSKFNAFEEALDFNKTNTSYSINQWIANNISKLSLAKTNLDKKRYLDNLTLFQNTISHIIGYNIEFALQLEPLKLVLKTENAELDFDVLPDGLRSIISWLGDLLMRMDLLQWENNLPVAERKFMLLLDEIEVHLHPEWQRKILPVVQKLFPNAQIFISTHSPFVVNSVDDAWIYNLQVENGNGSVVKVALSQDGNSISRVLSEIFGVKAEFGVQVEKELAEFYTLRNAILSQNLNGATEKSFLTIARKLAEQGDELNNIVGLELRQISRQMQKKYEI